MSKESKQLDITVINMYNGLSINDKLYNIDYFESEKCMTSGICIFFDKDMEMTDVIASNSDITIDADNELDYSLVEYYYLMYDEYSPLTEKEISYFFDAIKKGAIHIHVNSIKLKMEINLILN